MAISIRSAAARLRLLSGLSIVGILAACSTPRGTPLSTSTALPSRAPATLPSPPSATDSPRYSAAWLWAERQPLPAPIQRGNSVWQPVRWSELPGWGQDDLHRAWEAWLRSCERPAPGLGPVCQQVRQQALATPEEQHDWLVQHFQPYQIQDRQGASDGLLTGYFEPVLRASRERQAGFQVPLYGPPSGLVNGRPWFSRREIDRSPAAQEALKGRVIAWLADPIDALMLQIQGSGRLLLQDQQQTRSVRLAFAGHNGHPYRSVARWLMDRGGIGEGSWEAIRAWAQLHPEQLNEMLWSNPRVVFFREEPLGQLDSDVGPRGAQGVSLTPGRSIAVDRESIPLGTPVWLSSNSATAQLQRLVLAQDTGSAILGAVRADYFTGWGDSAYTLAATLKQPLRLWALWPRQPS